MKTDRVTAFYSFFHFHFWDSIWGVFEAYLRRIWGIFEAYLRRIWDVSEAYFRLAVRRIWGVFEAYLRRINWNCSNSVSFHAICLKFFLVGPLKISLQVLAFSELSGRLPLATFSMLVHLFCLFHCKYFLSLPSPVTLTFSNLSSVFRPKRIYCLT